MAKDKPQYQVIYNALLKKINKGNFVKEVAIPSENELALKYKVSRMTARKSIDMLVNEGYLARFKGKGTFITGRKNFVKPAISLSERLKEKDIRVYSEVLNFSLEVDPEMDVREALNLVEEECYKVERLRYANDIPFSLETAYLPKRIFDNLDISMIGQSLTELAESKVEVAVLNQTAVPVSLKKKEAKLLNLKKDDLVIEVSCTIRSFEGNALIYSKSLQNHNVVPYEGSITL